MAYQGVSEAVRARLEGKPFDYVPPIESLPLTSPSSPVRATKETARIPLLLSRAAYNQTSKTTFDVALVEDGPDYQDKARVYPSLSYAVISVDPRYKEALPILPGYHAENYAIPVDISAEEVKDQGQSLGFAPRMIRRRTIEHPFDFLVEIKAHAKVEREAMALISHVLKRLPPRHFLRVARLDGSWNSWDIFQVDYKDVGRTGNRNLSRELEYQYVWTYRVEGYLDTTDEETFVNLVRSRELGLSVE
jgi:hypothetical protein